MRTLLTSIALGATLVSFPALAGPGCEFGNPLNDTRASDCKNEPSGYVRMYAPAPLYDSRAYVGYSGYHAPWLDTGAYDTGAIGYGAYAYAPQRRFKVRTRIYR